MLNKNHELHLFIIWEKGRSNELEIIDDIQKKFTIVKTFSITWSPYLAGSNFTRFYGENLPKDSFKEVHCGSGEFKLIVVVDTNPIYENRPTSKGIRLVNTNMFDAKQVYRKLTNGGHKIHATDNIAEVKHDLTLLTGLSIDDFLKRYLNSDTNDVVLQ
jgi:hypothetical protein